MKTQSIVLLSICYLFATATFAAPQTLIRLEQKEPGQIHLQLANLQGQSTKIKFWDINGTLWSSKIVRGANGYAKQYDVRSLPVGTYFISVKSEIFNHKQIFQKTEEKVVFFQETDENTQKSWARLVNQSQIQPNQDLAALEMNTIGQQKVLVEVRSSSLSDGFIQLKSIGGTKMIEVEAPFEEEQYTKIFNLEGLMPDEYYFIIEVGATKVIQFLSFSKEHGIQINTQQQLTY